MNEPSKEQIERTAREAFKQLGVDNPPTKLLVALAADLEGYWWACEAELMRN